jgi:hypothetical protein
VASISDGLGYILGLNGPIQNISQGYATFLGAIIVVVGWWLSAKRERRKYQLENAHNYMLENNSRIVGAIPLLSPYLREEKPFPRFDDIEKEQNGEALHKALKEVLNVLEFLALDASTGRAYEMYIRESQRTLICTIFILSRDYIESHRIARAQRSLYRNYERLFVRIYIKRYSLVERIVEYVLGRPVFRYTYFMFQVRYKLASAFCRLNPSFRAENWEEIQRQMRSFRRNSSLIVLVVLLTMLSLGAVLQKIAG